MGAELRSHEKTVHKPSIAAVNAGILQLKCNGCREKEKILQRSAVDSAPDTVPPIVHEVLRSPGKPLDASTQAVMEPRFGHDFSHVRVHTDAKAAESARAVNALAYTVGQDIVFLGGQYLPNTIAGQGLVAHELAHVVQQKIGLHRKLDKLFSVHSGSEWDALPWEVHKVLEHSYRTRQNDEWIWSGHKSAAECFSRNLSGEQKDVFIEIYNALRIEFPWLLLMERVGDIYTKNVHGIKFKPYDRADLIMKLSRRTDFCRDERGGIPQWRKVLRAGTPGLHIALPPSGLCNAHIDTISPVGGRKETGDCEFSIPNVMPHIFHDLWGFK